MCATHLKYTSNSKETIEEKVLDLAVTLAMFGLIPKSMIILYKYLQALNHLFLRFHTIENLRRPRGLTDGLMGGILEC